MKDYSDSELADLAEWAEAQDRLQPPQEARKAYGAIRQGADWLIRFRTRERQNQLEQAEKPAERQARKQ